MIRERQGASTVRRRLALAVLAPATIGLVVAAFSAAGSPTQSRRVRFSTTEASWVSFDVSPDGRWIALDGLGQLWRLPIGGGDARLLVDAVRDSAELLDPAVSPDGQEVLLHGEYRGRAGIWLFSSEGGSPRWLGPDPLDPESSTHRFHSPSWLDGRRILAAKPDSGPGRRPPPTATLVVRDVLTGTDAPIALAGAGRLDLADPVISADGRDVFYVVKGSASRYPTAGRIWKVPVTGGAPQPVTPEGVSAYAPSPSPDGAHLAYFVLDTINRAQVHLLRLADSTAATITDAPDVTPTRIRWLGSDTIVYTGGGRLWRMDVRGRARREIPFRLTMEFDLAVAPTPSIQLAFPGERRTARGGRGLAIAPDGRSFALIALDTLWIVPTEPPLRPRALTGLPPTAMAPEWSPDGRLIAWSAEVASESDLFVTDLAVGHTRRLTALTGDEKTPSWSPDGQRVAFYHLATDSAGTRSVFLRTVPLGDSAVTRVSSTGEVARLGSPAIAEIKPQWNPRGGELLVYSAPGNISQRPATLRAVQGGAPRTVAGLMPDVSSVQWLPGDTLIFTSASQLWQAPFDVAGGRIGPARTISSEPAMYVSASRRGDILYVSEDGIRVRPATSGGSDARRLGWPVSYTVPTPGALLLRNLRIIDGTGAGPGAPQDVLVRGGRIERIVPAGALQSPPSTTVIDAGNRIAIPGLIDLHNHASDPRLLEGLLYFGVTTMRHMGGGVGGVAAQRDAIDAGLWEGPRTVVGALNYQTDYPFTDDWNVGVFPERDPGQIERAVRLMGAFGTDVLKMHSYSGWAASMRVVAAAHALGVRTTGHCSYPLALIASGIDGKEHLGWECTARDGSVWYDDLVQLHRASGVPIMPTLLLRGRWARPAGRAEMADSREVRAFMTADAHAAHLSRLRGPGLPPAQQANAANMLDAARKLHRAGVALGLGTDGALPDDAHSELRELVNASLTPLEAITSATSTAARILGASDQVGRIAPGLLADLVILDGDPGNDIGNTRRIWRVIQGGRVVDRARLLAGRDSAVPGRSGDAGLRQ